MGQNKVNRTVELQKEMQSKAVMVEMTKLFAGLKVFVLLPLITGIEPEVLQQKYAEQLDGLIARASMPSPREMMDMSIAGIPTLIERAKI
jgi:hypothetical protein